MLTLQNYVGNVQRNLCRSSLSSALLQMANLQVRASLGWLAEACPTQKRGRHPWGRMPASLQGLYEVRTGSAIRATEYAALCHWCTARWMHWCWRRWRD